MLDWVFIGLQNGGGYRIRFGQGEGRTTPDTQFMAEPESQIKECCKLYLCSCTLEILDRCLLDMPKELSFTRLKENQPIRYFEYEVPVGAPGGGFRAFVSTEGTKASF